jgi:hypothetical protein
MVTTTKRDESLKRTYKKAMQRQKCYNRNKFKFLTPDTFPTYEDKEDEIYEILLQYIHLLSYFAKELKMFDKDLSEQIEKDIEDKRQMIISNKGKFRRQMKNFSFSMRKSGEFIRKKELEYNHKMGSSEINSLSVRIFNYK